LRVGRARFTLREPSRPVSAAAKPGRDDRFWADSRNRRPVTVAI